MVNYIKVGPFIEDSVPAISPAFLNALETALLAMNNVDNTADADKAVSVAAQAALDAKLDITDNVIKYNIPPAGGLVCVVQYSSAIGDARVSADTTSTSVLWRTTYAGQPTFWVAGDGQEVIGA